MVVFHCYASLPEGTLFEGTVPCTYSLALLTAHQAEYLEELYTADRSYLFWCIRIPQTIKLCMLYMIYLCFVLGCRCSLFDFHLGSVSLINVSFVTLYTMRIVSPSWRQQSTGIVGPTFWQPHREIFPWEKSCLGHISLYRWWIQWLNQLVMIYGSPNYLKVNIDGTDTNQKVGW